MVIALGTTFRWLYGVPQNGGMLVKRYRVEERSGDMIEYQTYYCCKLTGAGRCLRFQKRGAVASSLRGGSRLPMTKAEGSLAA